MTVLIFHRGRQVPRLGQGRLSKWQEIEPVLGACRGQRDEAVAPLLCPVRLAFGRTAGVKKVESWLHHVPTPDC